MKEQYDVAINKGKEQRQKRYNDANYYYDNSQDQSYNDNLMGKKNKNNFTNRKLINGDYVSSFGSADTFSFKIPYTKIFEPFTISLYRKNDNDDDNDEDRFASKLFMNNLYFDKKTMFKFMGISTQKEENFIIYTDEILNEILEQIEVKGCDIFINGEMLKASLIKY